MGDQLRLQGLVFRVRGVGFVLFCLGFTVWCLGFRVSGLGIEGLHCLSDEAMSSASSGKKLNLGMLSLFYNVLPGSEEIQIFFPYRHYTIVPKTLVAEFISPKKCTLSVLKGIYSIPKSVKCTHSATK